MKTFFVTGLPRSRTAWIANYLTYGKTFCFHDGFCGLAHPLELKDKFDAMRTNGFETVGNSDPANLYFVDTLLEAFPDAYWMVIKRDLKEAQKACEEAFGYFSDLQFESEQMKKLESKVKNGCIVQFNAIDGIVQRDPQSFNRITPNIPQNRKEMLLNFQIQLTKERLSMHELMNPELLNHIDKTNECILA